MKVSGEKIPDGLIDDVVASMKRQFMFQRYHIRAGIKKQLTVGTATACENLADQIAGAVIKRERKAGNIGPADPSRKRSTYWRWIGGKA
ncbi:hypothetical protein OVY01_20905 [Robbsia sp. Bb-Pol-6]|uniref:Uncharacterized protein n=1 Tax=Robbsia betulipollinis TaxID=2981849 RepID=A0ABT3ZTR6_9BURK|nr:hypothetical protein [Robbsia betulipollinis]MCY0389610.1 hypothetical protein [Robbsia betulipollinis]